MVHSHWWQEVPADVNEAHYCHLNAESGSNTWCKWGPLLSSECWIRLQQLMSMRPITVIWMLNQAPTADVSEAQMSECCPLLSSECWIRLQQLMSMRPITVIWMLNQAPTADVNEAHYCYLNAESGSNSCFPPVTTWWSDWKLMRKKAGLRAQHEILCGWIIYCKGMLLPSECKL